MNVEILEMTLLDLEKIKHTLYSDFDDFWTYTILENEVSNSNSYYLVAKENNEILGFGGILQILEEIHITNIVTRKDKRNLGIASSILEKLILIAQQKKASCLTLEVNIDNLPAIKLYEKYDFKQVRIKKKILSSP